MKDDKSSLLRDAGINDRARKVSLRGKEVIVPLKFDADGKVATVDKFIFKRLSINDLRFLALWRETDYSEDIQVLLKKTNLPESRIKWFCDKLDPFRKENDWTKALCNIPSINHIKARLHVNSYTDELSDGQRDSLKELAKIEGAYKNNLQVTVTQNVFNLPKYDPETEKKLKEIADREAIIIQEAEVVNG